MKIRKERDSREDGMRGYILSISTILLFATIIMFARDTESFKQQMKSSYHDAVQISRLNYIMNDISLDMRNLVSVDYSAQNSSGLIYNITITDSASINKTKFLSDYTPFLQGYGNITGANISLSYSDPLTVTFGNGMRYSSALDGSSIVLRNSTGISPATGYNLSISANSAYVNYTEWNWTAGGTYVSIHYSDTSPSHTFDKYGYINASVTNMFVINYTSGNVTIIAGPISGAGNSIEVNQTLPGHLSSVQVNSTMQGPLPIYYNSGLNISYLNSAYNYYVPG